MSIIGKNDWTIPINQILHTKVKSCVCEPSQVQETAAGPIGS